MKKIIALLMIFALVFAITSCGDEKYPPVQSTELESQVVMTVNFEGKTYNVKYELYRALFLNLCDSVDGGDKSVWSGSNKEEYIGRIDEIIKRDIADIYSVFHVADKIGIDVYSKEFDKAVKEFIEVSVEGGYYDEQFLEGFDGSYDKYLDSLKDMNLNYSVQDMLLRYTLATEKIFEYYAGYLDGEYLPESVPGKLEYTREDVRGFYESDGGVKVIRAYLPKSYFTRERAEEIRNTIAERANYGDDEVINYIIGTTSTAASDVKDGEVIGRHNLDKMYYTELEETAFALNYFEVSDVIEISTGYDEGYTILYKIAKSDEHFEDSYEAIASVYVQNEIGKIFDTASLGIFDSIRLTQILTNLDRANITME